MYKTILVPVDLAEPQASENALATAARLADVADGTVRLIYVRPLMPVTYMEYVPASFEEDQQREAEEKLADIAASVALPKERVSAVVRLGSIYHEVLAEAEEAGADLVVVGSHRPTMATYLLGSNATTIVRHATSSVLVVR
ncbi:universal stress protein [Salinarimonas ramus]|uniref:Universal stress protein n=1 Tax=Salinarimonas ramus TaxID=690164 RepID=A0A917V443_9HYPH|nr:universal stress protein [Salinarimonas ramus]GGK36959.1 universal stress protein UspA [Salinarimonas ramus]